MSDNSMNLQGALDDKMARVFLRAVVWVLPGLFIVAGSVGSYFLSEILATQKEQSQKLQQVTSDMQVLKATLDNGVIWRITELERRINQVENAQKVP